MRYTFAPPPTPRPAPHFCSAVNMQGCALHFCPAADSPPRATLLLRCQHQQAPPFVAVGEDLEEEFGADAIEREV